MRTRPSRRAIPAIPAGRASAEESARRFGRLARGASPGLTLPDTHQKVLLPEAQRFSGPFA
jgi:hypothetical protein